MDAKRLEELVYRCNEASEDISNGFGAYFDSHDIADLARCAKAWAWVERHVDDIDIRGDRTTGDGWVVVTYNDGNRAEGATVYAAVLDAMEKEKGNG